VRRGLAREVIRLVQEARKSAGLDVSDRINLWLAPESADLAAALDEHEALIAAEVLAIDVTRGPAPADAATGVDADLGLSLGLRRA
jgi:isoleucyl-tRNA synthetase